MPRRPCPSCGTAHDTQRERCPNPLCPRSKKRPHPPKAHPVPYGERKRRAIAVREWVKANGPICPGFGVPPHEVIVGTGTYLTADHLDPTSLGGPSDGRLQVLCNRCNTRRGGANRIPRHR